MIVGVFGPAHLRGQEYANYNFIADNLDNYPGITKIITGGGTGVEQLALRYATENGIEREVIPPNIRAHGKDKAFIFRNQEILDILDVAVLFWDGNDAFYHRLFSDCVVRKKLLHLRHIE